MLVPGVVDLTVVAPIIGVGTEPAHDMNFSVCAGSEARLVAGRELNSE
jgi:hypothetical protein